MLLPSRFSGRVCGCLRVSTDAHISCLPLDTGYCGRDRDEEERLSMPAQTTYSYAPRLVRHLHSSRRDRLGTAETLLCMGDEKTDSIASINLSTI